MNVTFCLRNYTKVFSHNEIDGIIPLAQRPYEFIEGLLAQKYSDFASLE